MDKKLIKAAEEGDINVLYSVIGECSQVLQSFDEELLFIDNPLHIAAFEGHIHFAMEIMRLKPSLARKLNQDQFSPLHLALQNGKSRMVLRLIDINRDLVRVQGRESITPLHHVAIEGDLELLIAFLSACPKSFQDVTIRNETVLHIALKNDKVEAFEILLRWLTEVCYEEVYRFEKKILNWRDEDGNTLLHIAASKNQSQVIKWLVKSKVDVNSKNMVGLTALDILENESKFESIEIRHMLHAAGAMTGAYFQTEYASKIYLRTDQRLKKAAQEGDMDAFYDLINEDPCILDRIDQIPFIDTPMHIAASAGHSHFSIEMMRLKPTFSWKQNQHGFSPMHLALHNNKFQTALELLAIDRNLVRVKGREAKTPLHYVAETGNVFLLAEFLASCPESIQDLTIRKEAALHVAVKNDQCQALEVLLGWLQLVGMEMILQWTDDEGNTALHIATYRNQSQMVKLLINRIDINAKNFKDLTALDISEQPMCDANIKNLLHQSGALGASSLPRVTILAEFLTTKMSTLEKLITTTYLRKSCMSNENRNALLVVAVLTATTTFQAVLSPPGGLIRHSNSLFDFQYMAPWFCFLAFNTVAFLTSMSEIWFHLPRGFYFLLKLVMPLLLCYMLSLSLTMPVSRATPYYMILLLLSQWKAVARTILYKRSLEVKLHLLKHCPNLYRELKF
uniref:PGG domain-containing protein n=1 Tax=Cannabis sativa TaxID=3483 RepID=A0A803PMY0_CANSA